jgi:hypothetical protein
VRDLIESETPDETTRAALGKLKRNVERKYQTTFLVLRMIPQIA